MGTSMQTGVIPQCSVGKNLRLVSALAISKLEFFCATSVTSDRFTAPAL